MEREKKYLASWWFWALGLIALTAIVLTILSYAGVFTGTIVERVVFENSFQYQEARQTELATWQAQLAEIESKLADPALDAATRSNLEAQKSALEVRIRVARERSER